MSDVTLWIPGHFGGSDGLWPLLRHGPAPPGSAAEPGMAHAKGWQPPALCVHVPGLPRAGSQSWASCVREGAALLQSPVPPGRICFPSASALPWLQARLVPSGLGVPPLCPRALPVPTASKGPAAAAGGQWFEPLTRNISVPHSSAPQKPRGIEGASQRLHPTANGSIPPQNNSIPPPNFGVSPVPKLLPVVDVPVHELHPVVVIKEVPVGFSPGMEHTCVGDRSGGAPLQQPPAPHSRLGAQGTPLDTPFPPLSAPRPPQHQLLGGEEPPMRPPGRDRGLGTPP